MSREKPEYDFVTMDKPPARPLFHHDEIFTMNCKRCGVEIKTTSRVQKWCAACKIIKRQEQGKHKR